MTDEKRLSELGEMATTVIKEIFEEMAFMAWDQFETVIYDMDRRIISIKYETDTEEYELEDISDVLSSAIEGFGPCNSGVFYDEISLRECDIKEEYIEMEKEEITYDVIVNNPQIQEKRKEQFKEYAGKLSYVKYRAPEVLEILKVIEAEVRNLIP